MSAYWIINLCAVSAIALCAFICILHPRISTPSWMIAGLSAIIFGCFGQIDVQIGQWYVPSKSSILIHVGIAIAWCSRLGASLVWLHQNPDQNTKSSGTLFE